MEIKEYVKLRKEAIKDEIAKMTIVPKLIIIQINNDEASNAYVKGKMKDLGYIGANFEHINLPIETTQEQLFRIIDQYNNDNTCDGILVQMPLPKGIDEELVKERITPLKDVDGFHPMSSYVPCTPKGIIDYLIAEGVEFKGKNAVVIGRSNIVGKPAAKLLLSLNCNVTVLHSKTSNEDMRFYLEHADIVIVAVGKKYFIDKSYKLKDSAVIVDVGINRVDGVLYGDCEPNLNVRLQTPVPGGVGLLTRLTMLENLLLCYRERRNKDGI